MPDGEALFSRWELNEDSNAGDWSDEEYKAVLSTVAKIIEAQISRQNEAANLVEYYRSMREQIQAQRL